ncbi:MAG TPA: hypothetical protein VGF48_10510 [Thermoanaerobaculia bacterium]
MANQRKWWEQLEGYRVGDYTLGSFVGCGRIGYVYKATTTQHAGVWAVKLIAGRPRTGWEVELNKVTQLSRTPAVVQFHRLGTDQIAHAGRTEVFQYTVWDYIAPGRNLRQYLKTVGRCPTSVLVAVIERVLLVLNACRARGVARHGDLHAGNILVGDPDDADIDPSTLEPRLPIYISDFGYGATGGKTQPKNDYAGLASIIADIVEVIDWDTGTQPDRSHLRRAIPVVLKMLREHDTGELREPLDILRALRQAGAESRMLQIEQGPSDTGTSQSVSVGHFLVSEMLGDSWHWWKSLFVAAVPGKSRILERGIATVVTGPRGCGKTMLFRRLSSRVIAECGFPHGTPTDFAALYVNANDFADAFATFPDEASTAQAERLTAYANLCIFADFLAVIAARSLRENTHPSAELLLLLQQQMRSAVKIPAPIIESENVVDRLRYEVENFKWVFPDGDISNQFVAGLRRHTWLPRFLAQVRPHCAWLSDKPVVVFVDDYSTPRVSRGMQRVLNRLFFQRSPEFVSKLATEAANTFFPQDSSAKTLQHGDDYQMVDMGEESLFLTEAERATFLNDVFARRLSTDSRVPENFRTLANLLGTAPHSKTDYARRLRAEHAVADDPVQDPLARRRGRTKPRVLYHGAGVFHALWSGDTRMMIQLIQEVLDEATFQTGHLEAHAIQGDIQDRVFRNRGSLWLDSHIRSQPTNRVEYENALSELKAVEPKYEFTGATYGAHLKAVVEAFVAAARRLLLKGPVYVLRENGKPRNVPRMAFRIEVVDEFRVSGFAREVYHDLIRYGLFLRDPRGKSVRGAMVPRLFLRRLLLPYAGLALSKRDSVPLTSSQFTKLLLYPDVFRRDFEEQTERSWRVNPAQRAMAFATDIDVQVADPAYDDIEESDEDAT